MGFKKKKSMKSILSLMIIGIMAVTYSSRVIIAILVFFLFSIWYFPFIWEELNRK